MLLANHGVQSAIDAYVTSGMCWCRWVSAALHGRLGGSGHAEETSCADTDTHGSRFRSAKEARVTPSWLRIWDQTTNWHSTEQLRDPTCLTMPVLLKFSTEFDLCHVLRHQHAHASCLASFLMGRQLQRFDPRRKIKGGTTSSSPAAAAADSF